MRQGFPGSVKFYFLLAFTFLFTSQNNAFNIQTARKRI